MVMLDEILNDYIRMRDNDLSAIEALRALDSHIEALDKVLRGELALRLRKWERSNLPMLTNSPREDKSAQLPELKPIANDDDQTVHFPAFNETMWIECPDCQKKNRTEEVFCYSCGALLAAGTLEDTRIFAGAASESFRSEYFGSDSILIIQVEQSAEQFELRPQLRDFDVVIGRGASDGSMKVDVDLSSFDGANQGVSRMHLALTYENDAKAIQIHDLGSSNGSFINGQRLHSKEKRVLRSGDELRLGHLNLYAHYEHPGEEVT